MAIRLSARNRVLVHLAAIVLIFIALSYTLKLFRENNAVIVFHESPRPVPDTPFFDAEGAPVRISDFRGAVVVLNIWATWCVPCREEMPSLDRLQGTLGGEDLQVVALSIDKTGIGKIEYFFDDYGITNLAIYRDENQKLYDEIGVVAIPTTLIINRQGPTQQIWVAARSGGYHFDYQADEDCWKQGKLEFFALLNQALSEQCGEPVQLN